MSTWTVAQTPRVAFVLASVAILLAGTLGTAAPASGASPAPPGSVLTPIGHLTPTALGPGAPSTNRSSFAQPFRALNPGALRAAKLHAAAIASRGSRGPSVSPRKPLAGLFNNVDGPGLSQPTVAPPDSTGAIGPNNYVEMVNQKIGVYDRNLNLISSTDNGTFTGAGASLSVTDPQIQWDGQSGHWLYAALGVATGANMLIFGWSKTSDPSDLANGWCQFGTLRGNLLDDYPKLGHDDNFISIGTNVYDDSTNFTFVTANVFAIRKPAAGDASCSVGTVLYVADATNPLHNADGSTAFTPVPANTADSSALGYIVAAHSPVDGVGSSAPKIMVWHWALVAGSPALVSDGDVRSRPSISRRRSRSRARQTRSTPWMRGSPKRSPSMTLAPAAPRGSGRSILWRVRAAAPWCAGTRSWVAHRRRFDSRGMSGAPRISSSMARCRRPSTEAAPPSSTIGVGHRHCP